MELVAVTKQVPKDAKEVVDALTLIANHFLQKKPMNELVLALPAVMQAVDGWENVVGSVQGEHMGETVGYLVGEIVELFEKKEIV